MPAPDGPQFRRIIHFSKSAIPPHTTDHEYAKKAYWLTSDRRFQNDTIFGGDESNFDALHKGVGRTHVHAYDVPEGLMSVERYGDDDMPDVYARTDEPELWESLPAKREDAINNSRVVRFTNSIEDAGSTSYIIPKSVINDGTVRYVGRKTKKSPDGSWDDDWFLG